MNRLGLPFNLIHHEGSVLLVAPLLFFPAKGALAAPISINTDGTINLETPD